MSGRKQVISAGILALAIALAAIAGATFLVPPTVQLPTSSQSTSIQSTSSQSTSSQTAGSGGTLSILITDPPTIPEGVTGIYVWYSNVAVHVSGAGNQSGWTETGVSGSLDLMKLVNISTTIATVKVTSGVYNALRFNITSAQVTYESVNYTAFVPHAMLTVKIPGGIQVNSTNKSAAIIDMHPTVVNIGSRSNPEFIVSTAACVYGVPSQSVTSQMQKRGFQMSLTGQGWWEQINEQYTANIQITSASLSNDSLSVTVKNTGTLSVNLSAISVAPIGSDCAPAQLGMSYSQWRVPSCFIGSTLSTAEFLVEDNGTLASVSAMPFGPVPMTAAPHAESHPSFIFENQGYELAPGRSVTLNYSKAITFGFFGFAMGPIQPTGPMKGYQYSITVTGRQALAETVVTAT
jgi:hypothetical protein